MNTLKLNKLWRCIIYQILLFWGWKIQWNSYFLELGQDGRQTFWKKLKYDKVITPNSTFLSSKGSCSLYVSGYNLLADWQPPTLIPPLISLSMLSISAGTGVVLSVVRPSNSVLHQVSLVGWIKLHSDIVTLGTIRPEDSRAVFCIAKPKSPTRLSMPVGKSPDPLIKVIGEWRRKSLSIIHHALSPHPHAIIVTSFISSMVCTVLSYYNVT